MPNQLYSDNLGNALGTGLAQGVNNFLQRSDQLDEKNYQRGLQAKLEKKQNASDAYNYLSRLDDNFTKMQQAGGQDQSDPLAIAQTKEAQKQVQGLIRRLSQGDYSALDDLPKFQDQMDSITGQTSKGNDRLGALAYRGTAAQTTTAENQAKMTSADAAEADRRAGLVTRGLEASTTLQEVQARIASATEGLTSASQIAQMLGTIADQGGIGAQAAQGYLATASPEVKAAFALRSQQADTARQTTLDQASASLGISQQQLGQITEQRPELLKGLQWQNALQGQNYWQADKMNKVNLSQAQTDLEAAQFKLANDKDLAPDQKALLHTQLGVSQSQLAIAQATQAGVIKGTNSQNYAVLAENGDTEEFEAMVKDGTMSRQEADLWISLSNQKKEMRDLQLSTAKSAARQGVVAANVAEQTQQDQVKGFHYDAMTKGAQAITSKYQALYAPQVAKAEASSATSAATTAAANASVAVPLAQAGLQTAQGQAKVATAQGSTAQGMANAALSLAASQADSAKYQAAFDKATLQDKIASSGVQLQTQKANLTTALADSQVASGTVGARIKAMNLTNDLSVQQLAQARQQLLDMKQAYNQNSKKNPKELEAMDAALKLVEAQTLVAAGKTGASKDNQLAALTELGKQYRNDRAAHLRQFQSLFKTYATSAKVAVDQFDPTNFNVIRAQLPDGPQKKELDALATQLKTDDANNAYVGDKVKELSTPSRADTGGGDEPVPAGHAGFQRVYEMAKAAGDPHPEIVAAQWALESGYGAHASGKNNLFGIKAAAGQAGTSAATTEVVNGKTVQTTANFANYDSPQEGIQARVDFMNQNPRYSKAGYQTATTPGQAALALQNAGYATDPAYSQKLITIMKQNGYDPDSSSAPPAQKGSGSAPPPPVPTSPVGKGNYRSSGGGVYSSQTLLPKQWQTLDKNGFFKAAQTLQSGQEVAFVKKYGSLLYGPSPSNDQLAELYRIAQTVVSK